MLTIFPSEITVQITNNDIKYGIAANSNRCPLALCLKRKYPELEIWVLAEYVVFGVMGYSLFDNITYTLSEKTRNFVKAVDMYKNYNLQMDLPLIEAHIQIQYIQKPKKKYFYLGQ